MGLHAPAVLIMASAASLNGFRTKLVTCIDDLRKKREELNEKIRQDETAKIEIENKLPKLSMELSRSSDKLDRLKQSLTETDYALAEIKTCNQRITEAKGRYKKVCDRERAYMDRKAKKGAN